MPRSKKSARLWLKPASQDRDAIWHIKDGTTRVSTGFREDEIASAEKALLEYIKGKHEPASQSCRPAHAAPVADVIGLYLEEVVPKMTRPQKAAERAARLLEFWGDMMLSDISPATCEQYAKIRTRGGSRRDLEDLRAAINHHARRGLHSGLVFVNLPAKGKPRQRYLTRSEAARMLWAAWRHKRPQLAKNGAQNESYYDLRHVARFILMGLYTGSRSTPILKASIFAASGRAYIDLDSGLYYRHPADMQEAANKQSPICKLPPRLLAHIRRWRDRGHIAQYVVEWNGKPVQSIKNGWATVVAAAGLGQGITPHTLRHTCVTWLKQAGVSSFETGHFVGMSEAMVDRVYAKHDPSFQNNAIAALTGPKRDRYSVKKG